MNFYKFLFILSFLYLCVALFVARKYPTKRDFAACFFFTLITFFIAVDPSQKIRLMVMLAILTAYKLIIF